MTVTSTQPAPVPPERPHDAHAAIVGAQRELLDHLLDKWGLMILAALCHQPRRFTQLVHDLDGVTRKALTQALRRLERNGIIARHVLRERPLAVEYSITGLGRSLETPLALVRDWTRDHLAEVERHRDDFDARSQQGPER